MGKTDWNCISIINTAAVVYFAVLSMVKGRSTSLKGDGIALTNGPPERENEEIIVPFVSDSKGHLLSFDLNYINNGHLGGVKHKHMFVVLDSVKYGHMILKLHPRPKLIAPSAVLEWTNNNVTFSKAVKDGCKYFHGNIVHAEGSFISLGLCQGLMGVITIGDKELHIEPHHAVSKEDNRNKSHLLYETHITSPERQCLEDSPERQADVWTKHWKQVNTGHHEHVNLRYKRASSRHRSQVRTRYLETLVVADSSVVDFHGKDKVEQYLMSQMNIVDLVYHHASLGGVVNVVVTKILFMDKYTTDNILVERDARITLDNFCNWMNDRSRHGYDELGHHDMAVYITREDLGPAGYAPVTGMCNPTRSCSVTRDDGLSSAFVIAHEIAHIFGVHHDSYKNNCTDDPETGALMTTTVRSTFDRYFWSSCSREKFLQHIESLHCLDDTPSNLLQEANVGMKTPLGLNWGLDDQCRQEFGDDFVLCRAFQNLDPCTYLWCSTKADPYMCKTKRIEPLPGTPCDYNKWCMDRKCTYITASTRDGGWSRWASWDSCSRSCGGGVRTRYRKCDNPKPTAEGKDCAGDAFEEQLCNKQPCPGGYVDLRAQECSRLDATTVIRSRRHTWKPIENEDNSLLCKLTCISAQTNDVVVSKENVVDGIFCSYEMPNNVCIKGQCKVVGCDGIVKSHRQEDQCGVCDGDNSSCRKVIGHFRKSFRRGTYNQLVAIPNGARHIEISKKRGSRSFIAMKETQGSRYVLNGDLIQSRSKQFVVDGTRFVYSNKNGAEVLSARGPLRKNMEIMIYQMDQGVKNEISYTYVAPYDILNALSNRVDAMPTQFYWTRRGWSECSKTCGRGVELEKIDCVDVDTDKEAADHLCGVDVKPPAAKRACDAGPCRAPTHSWRTGEWSQCSRSCGGVGKQYRYIQCIEQRHRRHQPVSHAYCTGSSKPDAKQECTTPPCSAKWEVGAWSKCSVTCGEGKQMRSVHCEKPQDGRIYHCNSARPSNTQPCRKPKCNALYSWKTDEWSSCSHSCGRDGRKQRHVYCMRNYNGEHTEIKPRYCPTRSRPHSTARCNLSPCPQNWKVGRWSKCSVSCGTGVQSRRVICDKPNNHDLYSCGDNKPSLTQECTMPPCPVSYDWARDQWSECTATCGNRGVRRRHVRCMRTYHQITDTIHHRYCDQSQRPTHTEPCNTQPCSIQWTTGQWSKCSVTCGAGKQSRKVVCDKPADGSTYVCRGTRPAESRPCVQQPCPEDFRWMTGAWSECSASCGKTGTQQRHVQCVGQSHGRARRLDPRYCRHIDQPQYSKPCNQQPCPAQWQTGLWSECSTTCGYGLQRRSVTCQKPNDANIYKCPSDKPAMYQKCRVRECPAKITYTWRSENWSACSRSCGSFSVKRRKVYCIKTEHGTQTTVASRHCNYRHRPVKTKMCKKIPCVAHWRIGTWSDCSTSCGPGVRRRSVKCSIHKNGSNQFCKSSQPADTQLCEIKPCPETRGRLSKPATACGDISVFCRLARSSPSLCRNDAYRNRCCETCQRVMPS